MACDICRGEYRGKSLQLYTEIFMEKKNYSKPILEIECFLPNHYVASCFTYRANLVCGYGLWHKNNHTTEPLDATVPTYGCCNSGAWGNPNRNLTTKHDGNHHGAACAESTIEVTIRNDKVVSQIGYEGADKKYVQLTAVNIPGINQVDHEGQPFSDCTWESADNYYHGGNGVVTYFSRAANAS